MTAHSATLRGLVIGDGSPYKFDREPEGLGVGRYSTARIERLWTDGTFVAGADRLTAREVTFSVEAWDGRDFAGGGSAGVETLLQALQAAWAPVRVGTIPLTLNLAGTDRVLFGRPIAVDVDAEGLLYGFARVRLVFEATDPRLFSEVQSSVVLGLAVGGGMTFPLTFPLTFGAGSDSDAAAVNAGTFETTWTATITGPVTTPRITLASTGQFVELDGTVPAGSSLVVSQADGSVLLDGSPRQSWVTLPSRFFTLPPGSNTIRFRAASGTGSCTFSWRSAWL